MAVTVTRRTSGRGGRIRRGLRSHTVLYALLLPSLALIALFSFYPTLSALFGSLFYWNGTNRSEYIGFANYTRVLTDPIFWNACLHVLIWAFWYFTVPFVMPILVAEGIFNLRNRIAKGIFRIAILVPILVPGIVSILLWRWIYSSPDGGLNLILHSVGLGKDARPWLSTQDTALPALILMGFPWIVGTSPLIYLAGLLTIPQETIDASQMDGAGTWRRIVSIDVPHILPQIRLFLIFGTISLLQNISTPLALTGGGPSNATTVPGLYLYDKGFGIERFQKEHTALGQAMAVGVLMFAVLLVLTLLANRFVRTSSTEQEPR